MEFAYLDPGSGSIIATAFVGGIASVGVAFRAFRSRVTGVFSRNKSDASEASDVDASADETAEAEASADPDVDSETSKQQVKVDS